MKKTTNILIRYIILSMLTLAGYAQQTSIFLTPLSLDDLGNLSSEPKWDLTRNNIQGLWWNNAGNSNDDTRRIIMRLQQSETDIMIPVSFRANNSRYELNSPAYTRYLQINRSLSKGKSLNPTAYIFDCVFVAEGRDSNGNDNLFRSIDVMKDTKTDSRFSNLENGVIFSPRHGLSVQTNGYGTYFLRSQLLINEVTSNGWVGVEMAPWRLNKLPRAREGFLNLYYYAKSRGKKFVWLMNRGVGGNNNEWIEDIEDALVIVKDNNLRIDNISVTNQGSNTTELPSLPELNSQGFLQNTITGASALLLDEFGWLN